MNRLDRYADWLVQNADKKGTADFDTVANAYRALRLGAVAQPTEQPKAPPVDPTVLGQVREFGKGIVPGAIGLVESAAIGASALLPEDMETGARERIESVAEAAKRPFAAAEGYEDTVGRKFGQAVGSTLPFLAAGPAGVLGRLAALGLGGGAGAGEARVRAEEFGATGDQRGTATALGVIPGALEILAPIRIMGRLPDAAKASGVTLVRRALQAGGEEAAQEAASSWAQNLIAQGIYNPEQELIEGLGEDAAYGGATGALIQGVLDLALGRRARDNVARAEQEMRPPAAPRQEADLFGERVRRDPPPPPELGDLFADQLALQQQIAALEEGADRAPLQAQLDEINARIQETGALAAEGQLSLGLDESRAYEDIVLERERLRAAPITAESSIRIQELDAAAKNILQTSIVEQRQQTEQDRRDAALAEQSAFTQPDTQMGFREFAVEGDTQVAPIEEPTLRERRVTRKETRAAGIPTVQTALDFDAPAPMTVPEGAITLKDLQGIGKPMRSSKSWFQKNVVGKTTEQVQAMVDADPKLIEGKDARSQVLQEILAPVVPAFQESTDAGTDVRLEPEADGQPAEPSVGTPVDADGTGTGPIVAPTPRVEPSDGTGVVPSESDVSADPVSETTTTPAVVPQAAPATPQEAAFDDLVRAVQDETSPQHTDAQQVLARNQNNPSFLREYDTAVRRVLGYETQQAAPAPLPASQRGMPSRRQAPAPSTERKSIPGVQDATLTAAVQAGDARGTLRTIADGESFNALERLVARRLLATRSLPTLEAVPTLPTEGQFDSTTDTVQLRDIDSHTVLHEFTHAFTHRLITEAKDGNIDSPGVDRLDNLFEYVRRKQPGLRDKYGIKSLTEFAAESMANPEFQAELGRIPYQRGNAFTEFARSVLRMLGIKSDSNSSALAEALIAVDSMLVDGRATQDALTGTPGTIAKLDRAVTPEGVQAMDIVDSLGMNPPADPTIKEQVLKSWDNAVENPKQVTQNAKSALKRKRNSFETKVWSSDAALQNDIRDSLFEQFGDTAEVTGTLLSISTAQANGSEAIAGQFLSDGAIVYDPVVNKWVTQESRDNMISISRSLDVLTQKYGLTKKQAEQVGHTAFIARRLDGLSKSNDALYARADRLRAQNRIREADALDAQAKFIHMTPEQIAEGLELLQLMPELQATIDHWNGFRNNTLDAMVTGGLMARADAESWMDSMDYVPFYRDAQLESGKGPREYAQSLLVQKDKKLKGSTQPVHDVFDNMARWAQYAVSRAVKNRTGLALANTAVEAGTATRIDSSQMTTAEKRTHEIVRLFENGEVVEFSMADPLYMDTFSGLQAVSIPAMRTFSTFASVLRQSVVLNPLFSLAQVPQDSVAAMFTSGLSPRFALSIPARAVKEFVKTLAGTSKTHNLLKKYGVVGQRDVTAAVVRMDAEVLAGLRAPSGFKETLMRRLHHIAMASDNAVRQAVFEAAEAQGMSRGEAIEKAYQIINFRNRGSSKMLAVAAQTIPFFNAYLAATHVMYKTVTGVGTSPQVRAEGLKRLAAMSGSMAALSFIYAMLLGGDEDYENTRSQIRDRLLMIPGTGAGIPLRSDIFLLPKVLGEQLYQSISEDGFTDGPRLRKSMQEILANSVLSPTVVPQALKPVVEVGINHSFFTGRPLIGAYEQQMEKGRQYNEYTSELGKALGSSGVVSPIAADHLIRGVLGSLGGAILYTTTQLMHNDPEVERPDLSTRDLIGTVPGMASFITKTTENRLKNDFYELREATRRADLTFKDLEKRSPHLIDKFLEDKKNIARISLAQEVEQIARELSQLRKDIVEVSNAPTVLLDSKKKREIIKELRDIEKQLMKAIPLRELRKIAEI